MKLKVTRKTGSNGTTTLKLEGEFTIYTARKLRNLLMKELDTAGRLELDLAGVSRFDSAGYQLLVHAGEEAGKRGGTLAVSGKSDEVTTLLALYGAGK